MNESGDVSIRESQPRMPWEKTGWERVYDVVRELGRPSTTKEVDDVILRLWPEYKTSNTGPDLSKITVNSFSRGHYEMNARPRRTDSGHKFDLLYRKKVRDENNKTKVTYEIYKPDLHGVWEVYIDNQVDTKSKVRIRELTTGPDLLGAEEDIEADGGFEITNEVDMRCRAMRSIVVRRGQQKFRQELIDAYDGTCAITNSTTIDVLEAAHIEPYKGEHTNKVNNGLLLRTDIHTLFDLGCLWVEDGKVQLVERLRKTEYEQYRGRKLCLPSDQKNHPSSDALKRHAEWAKQQHL